MQGITYHDGQYWLSFGNDATTNGLLVTVDPTTGAHRSIHRRVMTEAEGVDFTQA